VFSRRWCAQSLADSARLPLATGCKSECGWARRGGAWHGMARLGRARPGSAGRGWVRFGKGSIWSSRSPWWGMSRFDPGWRLGSPLGGLAAWHGMARLGVAWLGAARQGAARAPTGAAIPEGVRQGATPCNRIAPMGAQPSAGGQVALHEMRSTCPGGRTQDQGRGGASIPGLLKVQPQVRHHRDAPIP
jgi:hypothetical protein